MGRVVAEGVQVPGGREGFGVCFGIFSGALELGIGCHSCDAGGHLDVSTGEVGREAWQIRFWFLRITGNVPTPVALSDLLKSRAGVTRNSPREQARAINRKN
jgi:hypothetical protein